MAGTRARSAGARDARDTRARILGIARELFAERGYAGTSIADIASGLGVSKAALYYHFTSKAEIVEALLAEPLLAYSRLAESVEAGRHSSEELLGAVIDTTAELHVVADVIGNDPSVRAVLQQVGPQAREINQAITAALAGEGPDPDRQVRAHAAYAVAKNGTLALMAARQGWLTPTDRAGLLDAALRALGGPP